MVKLSSNDKVKSHRCTAASNPTPSLPLICRVRYRHQPPFCTTVFRNCHVASPLSRHRHRLASSGTQPNVLLLAFIFHFC